jgi:hypothetical protein
MRKFLVLGVAALVLASPAAASKAPLVVAMKDPGCHWFLASGKYTKSAVKSGPVILLNRDEAALRITGPGGTKIARVGVKLTLSAKGLYHIKMVGQVPDDNTLTLKIK